MQSAKKRSSEYMDYGVSKSPKVSSNMSEESVFNRLKVSVRIRPLKDTEIESKTTIDVIDSNMLVFDPVVYEEANDQYSYHGKTYKEIGRRAKKNLQFNFDRVFDENVNNLTVYQETTKDFVNSLLSGYNCTVFAYGSTGSGKTYTMLGSQNDPGIIFFTTMDLYKKLEEEENRNMELSVSYFEIYNEIIYDLLDPTSKQPLSVLEDSKKGMTVKNLSIHQPRNADHLIEMLEFGNKNRKLHPTDANAESSRSHAIFQINLRRKDFSENQEMSIQHSKMSLIDLAGSERAKVAYKSSRNKVLCREGSNINKSLLALGNCINALSNNEKKQGYIPFRSSKLTLILRDSLGGNCQTLMIATTSPALCHYEETHNTLLYAERAKGVQLNVRKNSITVPIQPREYKQSLEKLTNENVNLKQLNNDLRMKLQKYEMQKESEPIAPVNSSCEALHLLNSKKNSLDDLFSERLDFRKKLLECEHNLKKVELRLLMKKKDNEIINACNAASNTEELKPNSSFHSLYSQMLHYSDRKSSLVKNVEENESKIFRLEKELLDKTNNDIAVLGYFSKNHSEAQAKDQIMWHDHCQEIMDDVFSKWDSSNDTLKLSFEMCYKFYERFKNSSFMSEELEIEYRNFLSLLEGKKNVVWRDHIDSPTLKKKKDLVNLAILPVYMNGSLTPSEKRKLVAVRDITPLSRIQENQPYIYNNNINMNYKAQLGNTVTKYKSRSYTSKMITPNKTEKENYVVNNYRRNESSNGYCDSNGWSARRQNNYSTVNRLNKNPYLNYNSSSSKPTFSVSSSRRLTHSYKESYTPRFRY